MGLLSLYKNARTPKMSQFLAHAGNRKPPDFDICNLLSVGRAGGLMTKWWTNLVVVGEAENVKRTSKKV